ncbi:MAG: hypothetical protein ISR69_05815 [Gammaproteobacteria bacterium]|nr:hypothetical protein [Gammaproteobacteria bacterium]
MLAIVINDELMIEYNHDVELGENKLKYLASLDAKFEAGLEIGGQFVADPDIQQRARYMAMSLMEGIMYNDEKMASVSVSWLATRLPDLKQVVAHADHDGTKFELIFDREYTPHVNVEFNPTLN